jgi:parvulin-like peptidyl-prolyl isomerase
MKRWGWIAAMAFAAAGLTAQTLDQPVATIKLDKKTSLITQKDFRDEQAAIEQQQRAKLTDDDKKKLLDQMISNELIKMDMDNQGIKASDEDLLKQFRASNPGLTDTQIRAEVERQSGKPWDDAVAPLKRQVASSKYFSQFPQTADVGKVTVTDDEVQSFFDANTSSFTAPDFVRVSHIFFDTKTKPKGTLAEIQKRADDALKLITSGQKTFEEVATDMSEDANSAKVNGDIGYVPRTSESPQGQRFIAILGQDFLNKLFALKKGEISAVLVSNQGLHIVRITQKLDKHFMTLDEPVYPGQAQTVKAYIQQMLQNRKLMENQAKLINDVAAQLRAKATVKTYEQNF